MLPKEPLARTETAFSDETVTPVTRQRQEDFSIAAALAAPELGSDDPEMGIRNWSPQQVVDWMYASGFDATTIECFEMHDINGTVLLDLQFDDLRDLDIHSFGKRHQLWNAICSLRGGEGSLSPQPTPFQDISRPCTRNTNRRRSPSRNRDACRSPVDGDATPITPGGGKKRRGRKGPKNLDVITPAESVSIVAIEQLLPKEHKCSKGERCAKFRKQQREIQQLKDEHAIGRFPVSPTKGGRIFVAGDPGNAQTAENIVPNVRKQAEEPFRPGSEAVPSVVASSDLLGPGQLPDFALHADMLERIETRDPQDNVRQFLNFQHMQPPHDSPPTPPTELAEPGSIPRSTSVPLMFPAQHHQAYPSLQPPSRTPGPHENLRSLPKLEIPRSASAAPNLNTLVSPDTATATSVCRSALASPEPIVYRLGTPASTMDVPVTAIPLGPVTRESSQSVPPNMQFRHQSPLNQSRRNPATDWRRPSLGLPAVKEGEVFSPACDVRSRTTRPSSSRQNSSESNSSSNSSGLGRRNTVRDPAHHSPNTQHFGYGEECTHAGYMKKRRTKMLRHEWQDAHFRLNGTQLAMHQNARLSSIATDTINVDEYAVACSTASSNNKLTAAMKAFHIKNNADAPPAKKDDPTAFAFQLVPQLQSERDKKKAASGKTHHFAVKTKDDRIDWMRELMLAKALRQKGNGYEVEVNGVAQA